MCNLYSLTTNVEAMRRIAMAFNDSIGNLPELPGIYPDYFAPIVRLTAQGEREIFLARWGLPSSKDSRAVEKPNRGTTKCSASVVRGLACTNYDVEPFSCSDPDRPPPPG